jgi:hypothetical protein
VLSSHFILLFCDFVAVTDEALTLVTRLLSIYLEEIVGRSANSAATHDSAVIDIQHLERVVHQVMLDF